MNRICGQALALTVSAVLVIPAMADGDLKFAEFDDCPLVSGEVIRDCRVGYRTFGQLNDTGSNAILFPTWFTGTTGDLVKFGYIGPGLFADSATYFIVTVDAFGNGVSSSPGNSESQHGAAFPELRIADMVHAQHRLLTDKLGISQLHAVMGASMGGMQALEWAVRYPNFMKKIVTVVGTPRQTSYDLLLWNAQLGAIQNLAVDDYESTIRVIAALDNLNAYTPAYVAGNTPAAGYQEFLQLSVDSIRRYGLENRVPQLQAMIHHDISASFGGSMAEAAAAISADLLIVVSAEDHMVNPIPSRELAELADAEFLELTGDCGHIAVGCEIERVTEVVLQFLRKPAQDPDN
ncbi:MAG TPA: alpha/beta hydrolase [Woeseiaceae bacterium]|nr:alpha/beta hydrolase [Woeseiaceae bacterium]